MQYTMAFIVLLPLPLIVLHGQKLFLLCIKFGSIRIHCTTYNTPYLLFQQVIKTLLAKLIMSSLGLVYM